MATSAGCSEWPRARASEYPRPDRDDNGSDTRHLRGLCSPAGCDPFFESLRRHYAGTRRHDHGPSSRRTRWRCYVASVSPRCRSTFRRARSRSSGSGTSPIDQIMRSNAARRPRASHRRRLTCCSRATRSRCCPRGRSPSFLEDSTIGACRHNSDWITGCLRYRRASMSSRASRSAARARSRGDRDGHFALSGPDVPGASGMIGAQSPASTRGTTTT